MLVILLLSDKSDRERHERAVADERVAALRAHLVRIQAPHHGRAPRLKPAAGASDAELRAARRGLVGAVEASITADARAREKAGELDGPITHTECGPLLRSKDAVPDDRDLSKPIGRYDCIAVKTTIEAKDHEKVAALGHPFVAALNFKNYTYVWCRNTPAQGERGQGLVFVRLQRECLAATGKALGTGYADVPDS